LLRQNRRPMCMQRAKQFACKRASPICSSLSAKCEGLLSGFSESGHGLGDVSSWLTMVFCLRVTLQKMNNTKKRFHHMAIFFSLCTNSGVGTRDSGLCTNSGPLEFTNFLCVSLCGCDPVTGPVCVCCARCCGGVVCPMCTHVTCVHLHCSPLAVYITMLYYVETESGSVFLFWF
jgi:hypothetical protein